MPGPIKAKDVKSRRVEWLWKERVPRAMITIVGGRPNQGKGLFGAYLAAEVSNQKVLDPKTGKMRPANVLLSCAEDDAEVMTRPRLEAAGANLRHIDLWRFQLPIDMDALEVTVLKNRIDLVIMDPLSAHLSGGVSRHSDNIRLVSQPLTNLIESTRTAVVIVEHVLKRVPQSGDPLSAIGGSGSGIVAASRMAYLFGTDPLDVDKRYLCAVKHNICEKPAEICFNVDTKEVLLDDSLGDVAALEFDCETAYSPMNFLAAATRRKMGRPADKRAFATEWLTKQLWHAYKKTGKGILAKKLYEDAKQFQIVSKTLRAAADDLEVERSAKGGPKVEWSLPADVIELLTDEENQKAARKASKPRIDVSKKGMAKGDESSPFIDSEGEVDEGLVLTDDDIALLLSGGVPEQEDE